MNPALDIQNLSLTFSIKNRPAYAVNTVSLDVRKGEMVALVGESGCGKTMTALSCMGLQPNTAEIVSGKIILNGINVRDYTEKEWNQIRGKKIAIIFQEPMAALDPLVRVGRQIAESGRIHGMGRTEARLKTLELMKGTGLLFPQQLYNRYPHQLSGGQRQRIMIASALINNPDVLIADEPTTSLDETIQAQILDLLHDMTKSRNIAILLITHDLGIISRLCSRVFIMYAGRIMESGSSEAVLDRPAHPYTQGLIDSIPAAGNRGQKLRAIQGTVPPIGTRSHHGCPFYARCAYHSEVCISIFPFPCVIEHGQHTVYCHLFDNGERL